MVADDDPANRNHANHVITCDGRNVQRVWTPEVPILESVQNELFRIHQSHMFECCGFIDTSWEVWKIPNSHNAPMRNFYMDPDDASPVISSIYKREEKIIALWHTHPNNATWPSPRDIRGWPNPVLDWRYLIVTADEIIEWERI